MAKKTNFNVSKGIAKRGLAILGGLAVGSYVKSFIGKKDAASGTDLLGLSGSTSSLAAPLIVTGIGVAGINFAKDALIKDVALGVAISGGAGVLNAATGKSIVSLGSAEEQPIVPLLPGMGDVEERVIYDDLPTDNEMLTTYHPGVGDADEYYEDVEGIGEAEEEYYEDVDGIGDVDDEFDDVDVSGLGDLEAVL